MDEDRFNQAASLCREAVEKIDHLGSFRLRVLMQMLLIELDKEVAARATASDEEQSKTSA